VAVDVDDLAGAELLELDHDKPAVPSARERWSGGR